MQQQQPQQSSLFAEQFANYVKHVNDLKMAMVFLHDVQNGTYLQDACQKQLKDIHEQLCKLELEYAYLKQHVEQEKRMIPRCKKLKSLILCEADYLRALQQRIPSNSSNATTITTMSTPFKQAPMQQQTPKTMTPRTAPRTMPRTLEKENVPNTTTPHHQQVMPFSAKKLSATPAHAFVETVTQIATVSQEAFAQVPKYMSGRLTLVKLNNEYIKAMQAVVDLKYHILALDKKKMSPKQLKQLKLFTDTKATKEIAAQQRFFTEAELNSEDVGTATVSFKDNMGKQALQILRHVGILKLCVGADRISRFVLVK